MPTARTDVQHTYTRFSARPGNLKLVVKRILTTSLTKVIKFNPTPKYCSNPLSISYLFHIAKSISQPTLLEKPKRNSAAQHRMYTKKKQILGMPKKIVML
jgi:hypothetical protein